MFLLTSGVLTVLGREQTTATNSIILNEGLPTNKSTKVACFSNQTMVAGPLSIALVQVSPEIVQYP
jgi:hypothetical protein